MELIGFLLMLGCLLYFAFKVWAYESYINAVVAYRKQEIEVTAEIIKAREEVAKKQTKMPPEAMSELAVYPDVSA